MIITDLLLHHMTLLVRHLLTLLLHLLHTDLLARLLVTYLGVHHLTLLRGDIAA